MVEPRLRDFALQLADAAREVTLASQDATLSIDDKGQSGQFDPVTEADRGAERSMRALIERTFPDHGCAGEEYGATAGNSNFSWSLDPIDGTRSYVCGLPTWTTLIAMLDEGEPVLGLIDAPRLDERYVGEGDRCWLQSGARKRDLKVSGCTRIDQARLSTTDPYLFDGAAHDAFSRLRGAVRTTRYGHDAYAYARLAAGSLDLVVESALKPHDYHALIPVVRGAGGMFGDWSGGTDFDAGHVIAAATPQLYEAAVAIMYDARPRRDATEGRR